MYYIEMRPSEIREAVKRNVPVIIPAGAVEYHGPHLPVGTDFLIADIVVRKIEERCECVVFPPLPFSSTMFWAAGPEEGEFDFDPDALFVYAREIFRGIVKVGFRRIYVLQHHQGNEGLPALVLKRAAVEVIREVGKAWGEGWGRTPYGELPNPGIFDMIRIAHIDSFSEYASDCSERIPIGHGGRGETQLIMSEYPDRVKLDELKSLEGNMPEWLKDAYLANRDDGRWWIEFCVNGWVRELRDI
ncbi:MAG: creatininase family protein [Clostridiales bacterium]|jgi:creatinine amidohydrolase|nr:creatininase family protein [Clostridiales bacterium]